LDGFGNHYAHRVLPNKYNILELVLIPLIVGIISFFIPSKWVKQATLAFATISLGAVCYHISKYNPNFMEYWFNTGLVYKLGLTFEMGYDGIGLIMLTLSNLVIFFNCPSQL